jgi:predicted MFS family arabinose efflux permease
LTSTRDVSTPATGSDTHLADPLRPGLSSSTVLLLTVLAAFTAANIWYNQPLLPDIARTFGVSAGRAGIVAVLTQAGYAAGLLCFVPLGDAVDARRLMLALLAAVTVALLGAAAAPSLPWMATAGRGRVVGQITGGLLVGILGARALAGFVGAAFGWRRMFVVAAGLMLLSAIAVRVGLPARRPPATISYGALLRSLLPIAREQPVARDAAFLGAMSFGSFSAFWTTLAFRLESPPLHYGSRVAGLFGLLGIAGAAAAPFAGYLADRRSARGTVGLALIGVAAAWVVLAVAGDTLWGIAAGVVILDAAVQTAQVSNQARIYALDARLYGRLNTIYMVSYFAGGALGSAAGGLRHRLAHPPS